MGPLGAARVGFINNEYVLNPQLDEMTESHLDLVVAGTQDAVLMVESEARELTEEVMLGAVMLVVGTVRRGNAERRAHVAAVAPTTWSGLAAPGWFPDPVRAANLRYWDGSHWTEHTA